MFSCLFLNPPYDYDDEARRLEHAFLTTITRALCPGGLLVFIIPQRRLVTSARYLAGHYRELACYRSILGGPRGARYRVVREFPLGG